MKCGEKRHCSRSRDGFTHPPLQHTNTHTHHTHSHAHTHTQKKVGNSNQSGRIRSGWWTGWLYLVKFSLQTDIINRKSMVGPLSKSFFVNEIFRYGNVDIERVSLSWKIMEFLISLQDFGLTWLISPFENAVYCVNQSLKTKNLSYKFVLRGFIKEIIL